MKKQMLTLAISGFMTAAAFFPSLAGQWQHDMIGMKYQNDDETYASANWLWLDNNGDGMAYAYYFDEQGYCLVNTITPDGYEVNENGEWVIDGIIQTKAVQVEAVPQNIPAAAQNGTQESVVTSVTSDISVGAEVWLSETGTKYHRINNCGRMNPAKARKIKCEDAVSRGYGRCKNCY